ncbi:MAG: DUF11 domain-containing protein [Chloroflexi bacterium]|nr:DUF11 domain-containing protein [Chloroflexota bacterium]
MKLLHPCLSMGCLFILLLAVATGGNPVPALSQGTEPLPKGFQITLAELGYGEETLNSPYSTVDYTLRLPEGWELREGSYLELDISYAYNYTGALETHTVHSLFGDVIITVDRETQLVFPINNSILEHSHLRVDLPLAILNAPDRNTHTIKVTLNADYICQVPHVARLIVHPTSLFSLSYDQLSITTDLSDYPRPFHQRSFEPDQVRFVLPTHLTEMELTGAVGIAAKLGNLTYGMIISGTTDLELLYRLDAMRAGDSLYEHLIVIGKPEINEVILRLNELDVLPLPVKERQLDLASQGPAVVASGDILSYTLTLTNTAQVSISALSLVDTLPAYTQMINCDPACSTIGEREISWPIPSLLVGETFKCMVELRLSDVFTDSLVENTVTLLDTVSGPLNVNTLTTTVSTTPLTESGLRASVSTDEGYFFVQGERGVPENDGVVQELVSPWDQTRGILVITGLNDEAIYKASRALSFENNFPGMQGDFALVREVRPLPETPLESYATELSFADLGYGDKILKGFSQDTRYYFDIPFGWHLTDEAALDLRFSHSQLLYYNSSFLNVLFNNELIATVALSDETALNGELNVKLPPSQVNPGQSNWVSIQVEMQPFDRCNNVDMWLFISSESLLYLDHEEQNSRSLDLDFYPYPFDQRSDLADVLFVLPSEPQLEEWEDALQLAAALGDVARGPNLAPVVATTLGGAWSELKLVNYNIIAIGRPSRNLVLQQVNDQLPQPFRPGSNEIEQRIDEVVFRLPPDLSLGIVQLLISPWNAERAFVAVTGTTDAGVEQAADLVTKRSWNLKGNLTLIKDGEVSTIDTRGLTRGGQAVSVATAVPEMAMVATATITPTPLPANPTPISTLEPDVETAVRPGWITPLIWGTGLVVVAIFAVVIWQTRRQVTK